MHFRLRAAGAALLFMVAPSLHAQRTDTLALSIEDAVGVALRNGDEARIADAQVDLADAQVTVARAAGYPQLRLNGGYTRTFESARGQAVGSFFLQQNSYNASARLEQTLFQGGRVFAAARAAARFRAASRLSAEETRAQLTLEVQRAYLTVLLAAQIAEIQATNYALASSRLGQVEQFERAGRVARYDLLRARVERANLEPLVIQARSDRELALLDLKRILNIPIDQPVALTSVVDVQSVRYVLASLPADSATSDPDRASVRAAELTAQARRSGIAVARADLLPTVSVFVQAGLGAFPVSGFPRSGGATSLDTVPCRFVTVDGGPCTSTIQNGGWFSDQLLGVNVSWALFDGLRVKGSIDLAQAQARLAELELGRERERVALEAAAARAELERARALYEARQQNAAEAVEAFRLASLRYSRGVGTQLDVSDAQLAQLTAQTNEAQSVYDLYLASAELARALGRPIPFPAGSTPSLQTTDASADPPRAP